MSNMYIDIMCICVYNIHIYVNIHNIQCVCNIV